MDKAARRTRVRVRYADTDQMGVVYYANYLVWFEVARTEWLRDGGWSYREMEADGIALPVIEAHCEYRQPARYDDEIEIRTVATLLTPVRIRFDYEARKADDTLSLPVAIPVATADPYYAPGTEVQWVARAVFDTLIELDGTTGEMRPGLATSWRWIDPRTLDLTLRQGVTFHDGSRFDADDVVYTLTFLSHFKEHRLPLPARFSWIASACR